MQRLIDRNVPRMARARWRWGAVSLAAGLGGAAAGCAQLFESYGETLGLARSALAVASAIARA